MEGSVIMSYFFIVEWSTEVVVPSLYKHKVGQTALIPSSTVTFAFLTYLSYLIC